MEETLRLFKAIQIEDTVQNLSDPEKESIKRTLKYGYVVDGRIKVTEELLNTINKIYGLSGEQANSAFHKSWKVIREASMEQLVAQQILHYITTYGFEALSMYSEDFVYIPYEKLDIPNMQYDIPLIVIKGLTKSEIYEKIITLGSGIALSDSTICDMFEVIKYNKYSQDILDKIKNKELKIKLFEYYGFAPDDPVEYLRYLILKLTGETLIIKNDALISKIKGSANNIDNLLKVAPKDLASIFYRFKPLFLAMKSISSDKKFFNKLRRDAKKQHKPMPEDYLGSVTARVKNDLLSLAELKRKLESTNIFRKVRLACALSYRINGASSIVYRVRNGRSWVDNFSITDKTKLTDVYNIVFDSIVKQIAPKVNGKMFYIPQNVHYAFPTTEKQFTGNFPTGSYISVPNNLIVGIHWFDLPRQRVDLDLSSVSKYGKIGWDSVYRDYYGKVLFSGDITAAPPPKGASELFYFSGKIPLDSILWVNYYNYDKDIPVKCKIFVGQDSKENIEKNYVVNQNKIIADATVDIKYKSNVLGLAMNCDGENRIYFSNINIGNGITSRSNDQSNKIREYLFNYALSLIEFKHVLLAAGSKVVDTPQIDGEYTDLSPKKVSKESFLEIIL